MVVYTDDGYDAKRSGHFSDVFTIHPESLVRFTWCAVGVSLLLVDLFTIPMEAVDLWTAPPAGFFLFNLFFWTVDIGLQAVTGYHTAHHLEMRMTVIARTYATTWFPLDLAILLVDVAFAIWQFSYSARTVRLLRLLRLVRIARLHKWMVAFKAMMRANTSDLVDLVVQIATKVFILLCLCHYTACAWWGLGRFSGDARPALVARNWVEAHDLVGESPIFCYVAALHWSITQFTPSTTNIAPVNGWERGFAILVVMTGFVAFSSFLTSMFSSLNQLQSLKSHRVRERHHLMMFLRSKRIPASLQELVMRLSDQEGETRSECQTEAEVPILTQLPVSIQIRLRRESCLPLLLKSELLGRVHHIDPRCFLQICYDCMADSRYISQQEVFLDGIESSTAYVLATGVVKYYQERKATSVMPLQWVSEACLWVQWRHQGSLVARSCCSMVGLDADKFRQTVLKSGGNLDRCLRTVAVLYAHTIEQSAWKNMRLTDLDLDIEDTNGIHWRAFKFCNLEIPSRPTVPCEPGSKSTGFMQFSSLRRRMSTLMDKDEW